MTIEEAQKLRNKLQDEIYTIIKIFEKKTGLWVRDVEVVTFHEMTGHSHAANVTVEMEFQKG